MLKQVELEGLMFCVPSFKTGNLHLRTRLVEIFFLEYTEELCIFASRRREFESPIYKHNAPNWQ